MCQILLFSLVSGIFYIRMPKYQRAGLVRVINPFDTMHKLKRIITAMLTSSP